MREDHNSIDLHCIFLIFGGGSKTNDKSFTVSASSCVIPEKGVPLTSSIVSPGFNPERSATDPSSTRDI